VDLFGDALFIEAESHLVRGRRGEVCETLLQTEYKNSGGQRAGGDGRIPAFKAPEGVATDEEAGGHVGGGDGAFAAGEREGAPEFSEGVTDWEREGGRAWHSNIVRDIRLIVNLVLVCQTSMDAS